MACTAGCRHESDWDTAEPRLASGWDDARAGSGLTWEQARPASRAAWDRVDRQRRGVGTGMGDLGSAGGMASDTAMVRADDLASSQGGRAMAGGTDMAGSSIGIDPDAGVGRTAGTAGAVGSIQSAGNTRPGRRDRRAAGPGGVLQGRRVRLPGLRRPGPAAGPQVGVPAAGRRLPPRRRRTEPADPQPGRLAPGQRQRGRRPAPRLGVGAVDAVQLRRQGGAGGSRARRGQRDGALPQGAPAAAARPRSGRWSSASSSRCSATTTR